VVGIGVCYSAVERREVDLLAVPLEATALSFAVLAQHLGADPSPSASRCVEPSARRTPLVVLSNPRRGSGAPLVRAFCRHAVRVGGRPTPDRDRWRPSPSGRSSSRRRGRTRRRLVWPARPPPHRLTRCKRGRRDPRGNVTVLLNHWVASPPTRDGSTQVNGQTLKRHSFSDTGADP
jgi:hypothetical protein